MNNREEAIQTIRELSRSLPLRDFARVAVKVIRDTVGVDRGTLFVVDHARGEIRSIVADRVIGELSLPIGFGIAGSVAQTGSVIDTDNPASDERFDEKYEALLRYDVTDIYCMPISNPDGAVVGVLELLNRTRPLTQDDRTFLEAVTRELATALAIG